jgi:hypothetical protein
MISRLQNECCINSLFAIKLQRHLPERIFADSSNEGNLGSQSGTSYRLIGTFAAAIDAIT